LGVSKFFPTVVTCFAIRSLEAAMETGLKRIEATLDRLNTQTGLYSDRSNHSATAQMAQTAAPATPVVNSVTKTSPASAKSAKSTIQPFPFPQEPIAEPMVEVVAPSARVEPKPQKSKPARSKSASKTKKAAPRSADVQPFPAEQNCPKGPALPKPKPPSFSNHRHAVNPNLAVGLLKEIETVVVGWQLELEQTILEIQALYLEGPIVDGWLESHPYGSPQVMQSIGTATLRHAEIERLMEYVEEICRTPQTLDLNEVPRTGYRLCGLDADGQLWSRPCPSQQVPYVSLAIARYQKLRILLARKQTLESRLNQLIQNLTMLHGLMQE
jgi:hypothetical protein